MLSPLRQRCLALLPPWFRRAVVACLLSTLHSLFLPPASSSVVCLIKINGTVAYAAQRAWIQNATLRDNVLFGTPFDPERYSRVLAACALTSDLDLLEAGDQTEIGEKG